MSGDEALLIYLAGVGKGLQLMGASQSEMEKLGEAAIAEFKRRQEANGGR